MRYKYIIYESPQLIAAEIEQDEPLPHIAVGHQLLLTTDDYQGKPGTALVVEHVRIAMLRRRNQWRQNEVHVFCREQVRPPPL